MGSLGLLGAIWPRAEPLSAVPAAGSGPVRVIPASPTVGMVPKPRLSPFPGQVPRDALGCPTARSRVFPVGGMRSSRGQAQVKPSLELCRCPTAQGLPRSRRWKPPVWGDAGTWLGPPRPGHPRGVSALHCTLQTPVPLPELRKDCLTLGARAEPEQSDSRFPLLRQETPGQPPAGHRMGL